MEDRNARTGFSAAGIVASLFGCLAGMGGITHGIGEMLQGNVVTDGVVIHSWTVGPIATNMGGEPAMTIVPNLLVTGVLNILVSLAVIIWAAAYVQRQRGGTVLILLSIILLFVGGGFGPPILGIIAGVAGLGIRAPAPGWCRHLPGGVRDLLARLWPWIFGACLINGTFLVVGSIILVYFFGLNNPDLFVNSFFFAVLSLLLTVFTGVAYDSQQGNLEGNMLKPA